MLRVILCLSALAWFASLIGCGGSSSETPFPLEPDLSRLDGGPSSGARYIVYSGEKQNKDERPEEPSEPEPETPPAR